jgi:coenzyme F420-reducing hydrogenase beta subunit
MMWGGVMNKEERRACGFYNIGVIPKGSIPCKDCEKQGCGTYHDQCPEYKNYKERIAEVHRRNNVEYDKMARHPYMKNNPKISKNAITKTHKYRSDKPYD